MTFKCVCLVGGKGRGTEKSSSDQEGKERGVIHVDELLNQEYVRHMPCILNIPIKTLSELSSKLCYPHKGVTIVVVQPLSRVWLFETPRTAAHQASLSFTTFRSLFKLMSTESVMPSNHLILCHPLLLLPSIFPSTRVFSNESALRIRWPRYWSFSFSISLSNEYSGLISFRIDWFDLLAVQETLKSLLQHHS